MIFPSRDSILRSSVDESSALPVHRPRYPGKSNVTFNRRNPRNDAAKLSPPPQSLSKKLPLLCELAFQTAVKTALPYFCPFLVSLVSGVSSGLRAKLLYWIISRGQPTRDSTFSLGLHVRLTTYCHKEPSILNMLPTMIRDSSVGIVLEYRRIVFRFLAREKYFFSSPNVSHRLWSRPNLLFDRH
jgi:hypothetical protein